MCLVFIFYQDLRYKAVYWICFPILALLLFSLKFWETGFLNTIIDAGYGLLFLLIQLLVLWGYFSIKHRRAVDITNDHLGWGDILFLVVLTLYLSPGNYILFYISSLFLVLIYALCTAYLQKKHAGKHIPLAGLQAFLFAMIIITHPLIPAVTLYNDNWIYTLVV